MRRSPVLVPLVLLLFLISPTQADEVAAQHVVPASETDAQSSQSGRKQDSASTDEPNGTESHSSVVIRPGWSAMSAKSAEQDGDELQRIPFTLGERARFPVLNYAVKVLAENVCLRSAPFATPERCNPPAINGTPVSSYPYENSTGRIR